MLDENLHFRAFLDGYLERNLTYTPSNKTEPPQQRMVAAAIMCFRVPFQVLLA